MMTIRKSLILPLHHVLFLLLLVLQVTGQHQPRTTGPDGPYRTPNQASAVIIAMLMFTLLFSILSCCICYKYSSSSHPLTSSDTEEEGRGEVPWRRGISQGLEKDLINSFPSFLYTQVKGLKIGKGGVECAICINEFEDDETLRLMPPCSHVFHTDCIDVWLSSRSTCPVCRASLSIKPGTDPSFVYPLTQPHPNQDMDLETGNIQWNVMESPDRHGPEPKADIRLLDGSIWPSNNNGDNRPPRSRSTGSSSNWRITEILFPRSHTTGHCLVPHGENLERFTLRLPEEVQRQLSQITLPQARSSRQGFRSGSVGSERRGFTHGRRHNRRTISLSFSFSFQSAKGKNKEFGEGSFERLRPEKGGSLGTS